MSALSRVAVDNHKHLSLEPGDTVALSSRIIPGNEKGIFRMMNHMARRGADIVYGTMNPPIHVSGHGSAEELKLVLNLVRPRYFVPIHGEYPPAGEARRARAASAIRRAWKIRSSSKPAIPWRSITWAREGRRRSRSAASASIPASLDEVVEDLIIRDRRHLSEDGFVIPIIAINKHTGKSEGLPEIVTRGFVSDGRQLRFLQEARRWWRDARDVQRGGADAIGA